VGIFANILSAATGNAGGLFDFFKRKAELKQELELTKLKSEIDAEAKWAEWRTQNITADAAWESQSIANSGWKDEYVLVLLSIPLILVFIPWTAQYVLQGFQILAQTPDWYRWLVVMIFAAVYGIRVWRRQM
jgi:hypothetical protein